MIGQLSGELVEIAGATCIVDCGGVGYEVTCSSHTISALGAPGSRVRLRVFTHMLESRIVLYGFADAEERELFDLLITVKKVGPASAVKILSAGIGAADIVRLIAGGHVNQLTALRGVGKKTAEFLVVELRDKCEALLMTWAAAGRVSGDAAAAAPPARQQRTPVLEEVASALLQLGWRPAEVDKAVATLPPDPDGPLETLLRQALRSMPR